MFPWETKSETFIQALCQATLHLKGVYHKPTTWNMEQLHIIIPTTPPPGQDVMLCQGCTSSHNTVQNVLPNPFCLSLKHRQLLCTHIGENLIPGTKIKRTDLIKKGTQHENWKHEKVLFLTLLVKGSQFYDLSQWGTSEDQQFKCFFFHDCLSGTQGKRAH